MSSDFATHLTKVRTVIMMCAAYNGYVLLAHIYQDDILHAIMKGIFTNIIIILLNSKIRIIFYISCYVVIEVVDDEFC